MHISKFRISANATNKLRVLRQRAGITPNLLCRMAIASSLEEGSVGAVSVVGDGQEFNAYTLFGADQPIYLTLLKSVENWDEERQSDDDLQSRLRAHIDRGIQFLAARVKTPSDVARLMARPSR